jgi:hypothetical protein
LFFDPLLEKRKKMRGMGVIQTKIDKPREGNKRSRLTPYMTAKKKEETEWEEDREGRKKGKKRGKKVGSRAKEYCFPFALKRER